VEKVEFTMHHPPKLPLPRRIEFNQACELSLGISTEERRHTVGAGWNRNHLLANSPISNGPASALIIAQRHE
jgi:hypothetical protein